MKRAGRETSFFLLGLTKQDTQKKSKIKNDNERSSSSFGPGLSPSLATARLKFQGYSTDSSTSTPLNQFKQQHLAEKNLSYPKIIGEPTNSSLVSGSWDGEVVTTAIEKLRHEISVTYPMTNSAQIYNNNEVSNKRKRGYSDSFFGWSFDKERMQRKINLLFRLWN